MENKTNILFVDDENEVLDGYKRIFFRLKDTMNLFFSLSAENALDIINANKIDILITDLYMPNMDGLELAYKVKNSNPEIIRMLLTGTNDSNKGIHASGAIHQLLAKPIEPKDLIEIVLKAVNLRKEINSSKVVSVINGIGFIPVLPDIVMRIEKELLETEVDLQKISAIISEDTAIVAKVLQLVNSSFVGIKNRIVNINQAVSILGANSIKSLILVIQLFNNSKLTSTQKRFLTKISSHSLRTGVIAKRIATILDLSKSEIEDAFIGGILHDIGKIILIQNFPNFKMIYDEEYLHIHQFLNEEEKAFGITHCQAGAYLLALWGLPDSIIEAIYYHHHPDKSSFTLDKMTAILQLADIVSKTYLPNKEITLDNTDKIQYYFRELDIEFWNKTFPDNKIEIFINHVISEL